MAADDVRFGLIGYGLFGAHHARAIDETPGASLVAVSVRSEKSRAAARAAHPAADVVADYRELVARDDIDVVDVVVPNVLHFEVASAALTAGRHVLLEKPMATTLEQCDQLIRLAESNDRLLAINHELRLSSLWGGAKRLIKQGAIGRPQYALVELSRFPYRQGSEGWRWDAKRVGSWILEEPIHFFDLARWYLAGAGDPISIYARASSRHDDRPELKDNFSAIVNFAGGAYAVVSQTLAAFGHHQTAKIVGSEGTIWAEWHAADARSDRPAFRLRYGLGDEVRELTLDRPAGELIELLDQIAAVAECVRSGSGPPCTAADGRWSTWLCLAAERSVDTGALVSLDAATA